jgi:hypothetical protein
MQSVLEREVRLLLARFRDWAAERDRAVVFGALLCCVPFLPVTAFGVLITLGNLLLLRFGKLSPAERPVLYGALAIAAFWVLMWYVLFAMIANSLMWLSITRFWRGIADLIWWFRPRGFGLDV